MSHEEKEAGMVAEDIYRRNFERLREGYLSRLFPEDREHVSQFITEPSDPALKDSAA